MYTFDAVLDCVNQEEAYETIGKPLIDYVIGGYNGTIFVYGQTSSGKTYTMEVIYVPTLVLSPHFFEVVSGGSAGIFVA